MTLPIAAVPDIVRRRICLFSSFSASLVMFVCRIISDTAVGAVLHWQEAARLQLLGHVCLHAAGAGKFHT